MFQKTKYSTVLLLTALAAMFLLWPQAQPAYAAAITVNSTADNVTAGDTFCTLREAIANFNAVVDTTGGDCATRTGNDIITLPAGTYQLLGGDDLDITATSGTLTIQGAGSGSTIIRNQKPLPDRVIQVNIGGITLILNDVTIEDGYDLGGGGLNAIGATTNITVNRCIFRNNSTSGAGGAIEIVDATLTINDSTFSSNTAVTGGAIEIRGTGTLTVNNSTFTSNTASDGGGAIFVAGGTATVNNNSIFTGNTVTTLNGGGAIYTAAGTSLTVNDSTFTENIITAVANAPSNSGGAINTQSNLTVNGSIFTGNQAIGSGGAIHQAAAATLTVSGSSFTNNVGGYSNIQSLGGAIRTWAGSTANISNSTFTGNHGGSGMPGGAISNEAALTISGSTFTNNVVTNTQSTDGGGAIINYDGSLTVSSSKFSGNTSRDSGGAISARGGTSLAIESSSFSNNSSTLDLGGAIETIIPTTITNSTFNNNTAPSGAAIDFSTAAIRLVNNTFAYNVNTAVVAPNGTVANISSPLTMINNIIAYSTGPDCASVIAITTNTSNLIEDNTCSPAFSGDPKLGTANNSGLGGTLVYPLQAGSPAVDKGTSTGAPTTDQRGTARPSGTGIDIGAYESPFAAVAAAVGGVAELITPRAGYPVATTVGLVAVSMMLMGAGAWLMRRG